MTITFETQEDFDKAVMQALHKHLKIDMWLHRDYEDIKLSISLVDGSTGMDIAQCKDYCPVVDSE